MLSRWINIFVVFLALAIFTAAGYFCIYGADNLREQATATHDGSQSNVLAPALATISPVFVSPTPTPLPQKLANPPEIIKAVYVTSWSAGSAKYLNYLSYLFENTEINAVVVNIKESDGHVSYNSGVEDVRKYGLYSWAIKDIDALVRFFHDRNVYVIGRIVVFEDDGYARAKPELAIFDKTAEEPILWQGNNGLSWTDPASKDVWDYNVSLARDAILHGFDEVNFDYIRFPSDGNLENMGFPVWDGLLSKANVMKSFFKYLRQELAGERISVDLFGQTTTDMGDMGIGQVIENAFENFDYVCPMIYPSHYINGFLGFENPAEHPYEVVKYSMDTALNREEDFLAKKEVAISLAKFRPWLQDFNIGAFYDAEKVGAEIQATKDALGENYNGFMLWNPSNIYTQGAIFKGIVD